MVYDYFQIRFKRALYIIRFCTKSTHKIGLKDCERNISHGSICKKPQNRLFIWPFCYRPSDNSNWLKTGWKVNNQLQSACLFALIARSFQLFCSDIWFKHSKICKVCKFEEQCKCGHYPMYKNYNENQDIMSCKKFEKFSNIPKSLKQYNAWSLNMGMFVIPVAVMLRL